MTVDRVFEDLEVELELRVRAWLTMAEQAAQEGDRWSAEIHKGRAEALHQFGLWIADHFKLPVGYGA